MRRQIKGERERSRKRERGQKIRKREEQEQRDEGRELARQTSLYDRREGRGREIKERRERDRERGEVETDIPACRQQAPPSHQLKNLTTELQR